METMVVSRRSVRTSNEGDGSVRTQRQDLASGRAMKTVVVSGCSVRTGHEDDGSVRTQSQDA
jgi:hypothetical protein